MKSTVKKIKAVSSTIPRTLYSRHKLLLGFEFWKMPHLHYYEFDEYYLSYFSENPYC